MVHFKLRSWRVVPLVVGIAVAGRWVLPLARAQQPDEIPVVAEPNQTAPESTAAPQFLSIDRADRFLRQTIATLTERDRFAFEADITFDNVLEGGEKVQYAAVQSIVMERPNGLFAQYLGDLRSTQFYYDGTSATLYNLDNNLYVTVEAPETLDETIAKIREERDISIPLSKLLVSDQLALVTPGIERQEYLGLGLVDRVPAHHLLFVGEEVDWQLWVSDEYEPVPLKLVITYKDLPGAPQYTAVFSNWDLQPVIATGEFTFVPPEGAQQIEFLPPGVLEELDAESDVSEVPAWETPEIARVTD